METIFVATKEWIYDQEGWSCDAWDEISSTNDMAKKHKEFKHKHLFLADHQSAGRGRGDNHWDDSGKGQCLLSTWCFPVSRPPQHITGPIVGLALFRTAEAVWPNLGWSIKAPNDLYLNDKKVAGLLVESSSQGTQHVLMVGLGMNVTGHPYSISHAGHLTGDVGLGRALDSGEWIQFLDLLIKNLEQAAQDCQNTQIGDRDLAPLLAALNANPIKDQRYLEVTSNGDLISENGTTAWHEL